MNEFNIFGIVSDYPFQWINLIFLIIPIAKAIFDARTEKKGIGVDHRKSLAYAVAGGLLVSFIDWRISVIPYFWQSVALCIGTHFLLFDYLRNLLVGKNIFYIDYDGSTDKEEDSAWDTKVYSRLTPPGTLLLKFWTFMVTLSLYYLLDYALS